MRLTEKQAREMGIVSSKPKNKYNANKAIIDGITFDSQKEAEEYAELKIRVVAGEIEEFDLQPEFMLQEGFMCNDKKIRPIIYRADFRVFYPDGRVEIIDTKGVRTKEYLIKKKMLLKRYPGIWFTEK